MSDHGSEGCPSDAESDEPYFCEACRNTGESYWSDDVYGPCMQCWRGKELWVDSSDECENSQAAE